MDVRDAATQRDWWFLAPVAEAVLGKIGMEAAEVFHLWRDTVCKSLVLAEPSARGPVESTDESAKERLDNIGDIEDLPSLHSELSSAFTPEADLGQSSPDVTWTWRPRAQDGGRYLSWLADQISWEGRIEYLRRAAGIAMVDEEDPGLRCGPDSGQR
jgi:hypothetical protein